MTNTTSTTVVPTSFVPDVASRRSLWRAGAVAGVAAAAVTTLMAAGARAVDIPLAVAGKPIPLAGFAQLTLVGTIIGVVLAKVLARRASNPRRTFTVATIGLTALSIVPDVLADATIGSKAVLMLTHIAAAAIVIPTLANRVARGAGAVAAARRFGR